MKSLLTVFLSITSFSIAGFAQAPAQPSQPLKSIRPGEIWPDNRGLHVQAHGGGIIKLEDTYYWFGEQRSPDLDRTKHYVSCYSSKDLTNWVFHRNVVELADPENIGQRWVLERPKVFHNPKTKKFVMYVHLDGPTPLGGGDGHQGGGELCDRPRGGAHKRQGGWRLQVLAEFPSARTREPGHRPVH